jgi:hypothetical protein
MAKYAIYTIGGKSVLNEFEADKMMQNGSHVQLFVSKGGGDDQVAAIQLSGAQFVAC